jgi:hypothetical protein
MQPLAAVEIRQEREEGIEMTYIRQFAYSEHAPDGGFKGRADVGRVVRDL